MNEIIIKDITARITYYRLESDKYSAMKKNDLANKYEHMAAGLEEAHKIMIGLLLNH